jgi:hypothetical protein
VSPSGLNTHGLDDANDPFELKVMVWPLFALFALTV